jgi:hypothetical protein
MAYNQCHIASYLTGYIALLIYTCFCAYTVQVRYTANGKIRREIQKPQMFETDPEVLFPSHLL